MTESQSSTPEPSPGKCPTRICDLCGRVIEPNALRYIAKIQVFAAYDPIQIGLEDLLEDHRREINDLIEQCSVMTEEELMKDVCVQFQFDLCRSCQRAYVASPLRGASFCA